MSKIRILADLIAESETKDSDNSRSARSKKIIPIIKNGLTTLIFVRAVFCLVGNFVCVTAPSGIWKTLA